MLKNLPKEITTYDVLKTVALLLMVLDHIGHYIFPFDPLDPHGEYIWFRILGRLCVPMWFFLIGYARSARIDKYLVAGALIVALSAPISGQFLLPVNILFTIMIMRYYRQPVVANAFDSIESLRGMFLILFFLSFPTGLIFEYGTLSMLFVLVGHMVRYRSDIETRIEPFYLRLFVVGVFAAYLLHQGIGLPYLDFAQAGVLFVGGALVGVWLWAFDGKALPDKAQYIPSFLRQVIQFTGRRTLLIYVVHLLVLRIACALFFPEKYDWFYFQVISPDLVRFFT